MKINPDGNLLDETLEDDLVETPQEKIMNAAAKVIRAGIWLIRNGYGRMMLLPYAAPSGCYWRCEYHPPLRPSKAFYRYSTGNETRYLASHCGGSIKKDVSPKTLAQAILKSVPDDVQAACSGEASPETLRWLETLEQVLAEGYIPQAFHEYSEEYSRWDLVSLTRAEGRPMEPQPGYIQPGEEKSIADDPEWQKGEAQWESLVGSNAVLVPTTILADDNACYELADKLRRAMVEADKFAAMRLLRSLIGSLASPQIRNE